MFYLIGTNTFENKLGQFLLGDAHASRTWRLFSEFSGRKNKEQQISTGVAYVT
jgi:hypothetical protein